jgi:tetratricopeptide (TPR) repeat protein
MNTFYLDAAEKSNKCNYEYIDKMVDLININNDVHTMCSLGNYYKCIGDYEKMQKYYLMAIDYNNEIKYNYTNLYTYSGIDAMYELGDYYKRIENYEEMKKYYLMAIRHHYIEAMRSLSSYYEKVEHNLDEAKKYYVMAMYVDKNQD